MGVPGKLGTNLVADATSALNNLLNDVEKVIVFGHSMGGLVALSLAADHTEKIDSLIVAAAAIQSTSPLAPGNPLHFLMPPLAPILRLFIRRKALAPNYADPALNASHTNYPWAPIDAILSFLHFTQVTRRRLPEVNVPILIMHSHNDSVIAPKSAKIIYSDVTTPAAEKRLVWFDKTEHEMFRDCEREATTGAVVAYVRERIAVGEVS